MSTAAASSANAVLRISHRVGASTADRAVRFRATRLLTLFLAGIAFVPAAGAEGGGFFTLKKLSNHADPSLPRVSGGGPLAPRNPSPRAAGLPHARRTNHTP